MTTLFSSLAPVKPARRFGVGILATRPAYRADHTAADAAWLAADDARRDDEDRRHDAAASESAHMDRYERGLCC
jgi:hypothetical protein